MTISERIRPGSEAAEWVCIEVGQLEVSYEAMKQQLAECQKECEEEARLNGAGGSREAALLARLEEALAREKALLEIVARALETAENDWYKIDSEWGPAEGGLAGEIQRGVETNIPTLRKALATPQDSTALDTAIKESYELGRQQQQLSCDLDKDAAIRQAKRDVVVVLARNLGWEVEELERRMADEMN